jgi:hypothetical protein
LQYFTQSVAGRLRPGCMKVDAAESSRTHIPSGQILFTIRAWTKRPKQTLFANA